MAGPNANVFIITVEAPCVVSTIIHVGVALLNRHDTASKELTGHHRKCDMMCSAAGGGMLRREKLEEMYLFLKSNILSGKIHCNFTDLKEISA